MSVLRGVLQFCILGLLGASLAIYRPTELTSIAGVCFFFGALFAATFLLGIGAAKKLTERKIFLVFESFALVIVVCGVLSKTENLLLALILALAVWWGLMLAFLAHPVIGHFTEEKEYFHSLPSKDSSLLSRLHKFAFAFFYVPIFAEKEFYFCGFMALAILYLIIIFLGINMPIADWGKTKARTEIAKSNLELVNMNNEQERTNFEQEIRLKVNQIQLKKDGVKIAQRANEASNKRFDLSTQRYRDW